MPQRIESFPWKPYKCWFLWYKNFGNRMCFVVRAAILSLVILFRFLAIFLVKVGHVAYQTKAFDEIHWCIKEFLRLGKFSTNNVFHIFHEFPQFLNNLVDLIECFRLICYMTYFGQKHSQKSVKYHKIVDFLLTFSFKLFKNYSIDFNNLCVILKANISSF